MGKRQQPMTFCVQTKRQPWSFVLLLVAMLVSSVAAEGTTEEGLTFLENNRNKPGVIELRSGLQYKVLKQGTGEYNPTMEASCSCHYAGQLLDGTEFDSSFKRNQPSTFTPQDVIEGWQEAMLKMVEGDKFELYIPSELAYGDEGFQPKIPGGAVLVFQLELLKILDEKEKTLAYACSISNTAKCTEQEVAYVKKVKDWGEERQRSEMERLQKLVDPFKTRKSLFEWVKRRFHILAQYITAAANADTDGSADEL